MNHRRGAVSVVFLPPTPGTTLGGGTACSPFALVQGAGGHGGGAGSHGGSAGDHAGRLGASESSLVGFSVWITTQLKD
jgi:hypothetical protein